MILALVGDLFFTARIRETARQLGLPCQTARDPDSLLARARSERPRLIIVDMNLRGHDAPAAVRALKADDSTRTIPVVGYLFDSHEALITEARRAGCDRVLSRGGLTKRLPELLASAAAEPA